MPTRRYAPTCAGRGKGSSFNPAWRSEKKLWAEFGIGLCGSGRDGLVVAYGVYASNILPMQAAADVNYGYAYASADPKRSMEFFEDSVNTPFNFDFGETTSRYAETALGAAYNQNVPRELSVEIMDKSIEALKYTVARVDNNPIVLPAAG